MQTSHFANEETETEFLHPKSWQSLLSEGELGQKLENS